MADFTEILDALTVVSATASHSAAEIRARQLEVVSRPLSSDDAIAALKEAEQSFAEIGSAAARIEALVAALSLAQARSSGPRVDAEPEAKPRILIVDDDPAFLRMLGRMLEHYEVECAPTGADALRSIENGMRFDAIVCDVAMPGMTGPDLYGRLQRFPGMAQRMIFTTGGSDDPRAEEFRRLLASRFLDKPFSASSLHLAIDAVCRGNR